jgi:hypothetical protein
MDETVAAIRALDTDKDIINRACVKVSLPDAATITDEGVIAHEILMRYCSLFEDEPQVLVAALTVALGTLAGLVCRPGSEPAMLSHIVDAITDQFLNTRSKQIADLRSKDPTKAKEAILAVIEGIVASGILTK